MNSFRSILIYFLQFLFGAVFIFSAVMKHRPIEPIEFSLVDAGLATWTTAPFFSRILVGIELMLGLLLILNLYKRLAVKISLGLLLLFSGYLAFLLLDKGNVENCNCFGLHLKFSPLESLIKNGLLIGIGIILLLKPKNLFLIPRGKKIITGLVLLGSLSFPFIYEPVGMNSGGVLGEDNLPLHEDFLPLEESEFNNGKTYDYSEGKHILAFFSMHCRFCKLSAKKLSIIDDHFEDDLPLTMVFFGDEKDMEQFWEDSGSSKYPYKVIQPDLFFKLSGNSLPSIYLIDKGKVEEKMGFREIEEEELIRFLKEE